MKPVIIFFKNSYLDECKRMEADIFSRGFEDVLKNFDIMKIDVDKRPEFFLRYGGREVPGLTFTTPDGRIILIGGYITRDKFSRILTDFLITLREFGDEVMSFALDFSDISPFNADINFSDLEKIGSDIVSQILDRDMGGVGFGPKIGGFEVLRYFILRRKEVDFVLKTLSAFERMWDKVEGGYFLGSRTRDFSYLITSKLTKIQFELVDIFLLMYKITGEDKWIRKVREVLDFVMLNLLLDGVFIHGIEESAEYYRSTKSIRDVIDKPSKDINAYSDENFFALSKIYEASNFIPEYRKLFPSLEKSILEKFVVYDVLHSIGGELKNYLRDIAYYIEYLVKVGNFSEAERVLSQIQKQRNDFGLFYDHIPSKDGFGFLKYPKIDIEGNLILAKALAPFKKDISLDILRKLVGEIFLGNGSQYLPLFLEVMAILTN